MKAPAETKAARKPDPMDLLLGQTDCKKHYDNKADYSPGDLLVDALNIDGGLEISSGLRTLASELDLLSDSVIHGDGSSRNEDVLEWAFYSVCQRLRVLAEIDDRVRSALRGELNQLRAALAERDVKRLPKARKVGAR